MKEKDFNRLIDCAQNGGWNKSPKFVFKPFVLPPCPICNKKIDSSMNDSYVFLFSEFEKGYNPWDRWRGIPRYVHAHCVSDLRFQRYLATLPYKIGIRKKYDFKGEFERILREEKIKRQILISSNI